MLTSLGCHVTVLLAISLLEREERRKQTREKRKTHTILRHHYPFSARLGDTILHRQCYPFSMLLLFFDVATLSRHHYSFLTSLRTILRRHCYPSTMLHFLDFITLLGAATLHLTLLYFPALLAFSGLASLPRRYYILYNSRSLSTSLSFYDVTTLLRGYCSSSAMLHFPEVTSTLLSAATLS